MSETGVSRVGVFGALALAVAQLSCSGSVTSPDLESGSAAPRSGAIEVAGEGGGEAFASQGELSVQHSPNSAPSMVLRTRPAAVPGDPYPVISGSAPLEVHFNLCRSSDPDEDPGDHGEGDRINWQFHFGDDGTSPFNSDGTFNANVGQQCRTSRTYQEGVYVATVSVTDRHLEDQSRDVAGLARVTKQLHIVVSRGGGGSGSGFGTSSSLTTLFAGNNNFAGNTFDLQSSVPLQITGFAVNISAGGGPPTETVAVYWRGGTAVGNENNPGAWTLLGKDTNVTVAGFNAPSMVNVGGLTLTPGQVYGIYVDLESYTTNVMNYTNGGPTAFANGDLTLTTNTGQASPAFSGSFFPRQWNGTVFYVK